MKKFLLLLAVVMLAFTSQAQLVVKNSAAGTYSAVADTLLESDTIVYDFTLNGANPFMIDVNLKVVKVSGTVTSNFLFYKTLDGVNYTATGDTIVLSNVSGTTYNWKQLTNANWKGFKLQAITGVTAQKAAYNLQYCIRSQP
jgi:hypothetical protein